MRLLFPSYSDLKTRKHKQSHSVLTPGTIGNKFRFD